MNDFVIFFGGFYLKIGRLEIHADAISKSYSSGHLDVYWGNSPVIEFGCSMKITLIRTDNR
jgi:hypothetical protein